MQKFLVIPSYGENGGRAGHKSFYYIGKDNITFHAVTWPAELLGMGPSFDEAMGSKPKAVGTAL